MATMRAGSPAEEELLAPRIRVARSLRRMIQDGTLAVGDPVPSEQTLALRLGFSRAVIRAACALLESDGLIRVHGRGRIVIAPPTAVAAAPQTIIALVGGTVGPQPAGHRSIGWNSQVQAEISRRLRTAGMLVRPMPLDALDSAFSQPPGQRPGGMIVLADGGAQAAALKALVARWEVPQVVYGADRDRDEVLRLDAVVSDHAAGGAALVRWLAGRGRRQLQPVWHLLDPDGPLPPWLARREAGMAVAAAELGVALLPALRIPVLPWPHPADDVRPFFQVTSLASAGALVPVLKRHPQIDALLLTNDHLALYTVHGLRRLGLYRDEVLIAGYDGVWADLPEQVWAPWAPAVTIERGNLAIGAALAAVLLDRLQGRAPLAPQLRVIAPTVVVP